MVSLTIFHIPPLKEFTKQFEPRLRLEKERKEIGRGVVDARACVHCNTLTYLHHTQIILQSNFKSNPPPFFEEIQRDLRVVAQKSDHIIFMGYSLPPDDVDYRAFFRSQATAWSLKRGEMQRCHRRIPKSSSLVDAKPTIKCKTTESKTLSSRNVGCNSKLVWQRQCSILWWRDSTSIFRWSNDIKLCRRSTPSMEIYGITVDIGLPRNRLRKIKIIQDMAKTTLSLHCLLFVAWLHCRTFSYKEYLTRICNFQASTFTRISCAFFFSPHKI